MKFRIIFGLLLALSILPALRAQTRTPKARPARHTTATRAWPAFFAAFREAVMRRERGALKMMLAKDIYFSGGGGDDNGDGDMRDDAFKFWDEETTRGWEHFDLTLEKGVVMLPPSSNFTGGKYPSRVAPPGAASRRIVSKGLVDWYAVFEFREDGRWYCTVFNQCCD